MELQEHLFKTSKIQWIEMPAAVRMYMAQAVKCIYDHRRDTNASSGMYFVHEQPLRQLVVILAVPLFHVSL